MRSLVTILLVTLFCVRPVFADPVAYEIVNGREIPNSLTGSPGDAERGRQLYFDLEATGCSGCHGSPSGPGAQSSGVAAPSLSGLGDRMEDGVIRLWIVAPQVLAEMTTKPAYYAAGQRDNPHDPRFGMPRLRAAEVEALVAYLSAQ